MSDADWTPDGKPRPYAPTDEFFDDPLAPSRGCLSALFLMAVILAACVAGVGLVKVIS